MKGKNGNCPPFTTLFKRQIAKGKFKQYGIKDTRKSPKRQTRKVQNLTETFTFFVGFSYTTTLFYCKMIVVHIFLLGVCFFCLTYCTRDLYELFLFSSGVALESIIHLFNKAIVYLQINSAKKDGKSRLFWCKTVLKQVNTHRKQTILQRFPTSVFFTDFWAVWDRKTCRNCTLFPH